MGVLRSTTHHSSPMGRSMCRAYDNYAAAQTSGILVSLTHRQQFSRWPALTTFEPRFVPAYFCTTTSILRPDNGSAALRLQLRSIMAAREQGVLRNHSQTWGYDSWACRFRKLAEQGVSVHDDFRDIPAICVFLILAALYESWCLLPFQRMLSTPWSIRCLRIGCCCGVIHQAFYSGLYGRYG